MTFPSRVFLPAPTRRARFRCTFSRVSQSEAALVPSELTGLLQAHDPAARDAAWQRFVDTYSRLLLHTARSLDADYDHAMDAYAYLLEQLARDDFSRLRAYTPDSRSKFTTWLVVVARRICVDRLRARYGRHARTSSVRRRLADLLVDELDPAITPIPDGAATNPETSLRARELSRALTAAFARLDPSDRLLLKLRYEDDLPARELGRLLHFPTPFHVYRRLNALLKELKTALQSRGIDGSDA